MWPRQLIIFELVYSSPALQSIEIYRTWQLEDYYRSRLIYLDNLVNKFFLSRKFPINHVQNDLSLVDHNILESHIILGQNELFLVDHTSFFTPLPFSEAFDILVEVSGKLLCTCEL